MIPLIALLILTACLAGTLQGMIMIKPFDEQHGIIAYPKMYDSTVMHLPVYTSVDDLEKYLEQFNLGVRLHVWFRFYHAIWGAFLVSLFLWSRMVCFDWKLLLLQAVLANDVFEYAYSYARFRVFYNPYIEHFNIADVIRFHTGSKFAHTLRAIAIVALGVMIWIT